MHSRSLTRFFLFFFKSDSSSTKAIAVMTMAFLPGTFLAALFTVPSLPVQMQREFWVYWVSAIPVTLFVFGRYQHAKMVIKRGLLLLHCPCATGPDLLTIDDTGNAI